MSSSYYLKKLILIRHAKSSWDYNVSDLERPLSNRGFNDAKLMSTILNDFSIKIDGVFSSNAKRTIQTAQIFLKNLTNYKKLFIVESTDLYDFLGENVSTLPAGISGSANSSISTTASGFHQIFIRYELDTGNGKLAEFRH